MSFLRHVGKHGDRKVAIIFREVPGEPHMALITYTETLNQHIHDPMMRCIESDIGQNSENLADALNRSYTQDGRPILQVLHSEGLLKKVNTAQVVVTPNPQTKIKLEELNSILNEMKQGENAVKRLQEMDASRGLQDPMDVAKRMRGDRQVPPPINQAPQGVLGDTALAQQRLQQAQRMAAEARGLLAESDRLMQEAQQMDPSLAPAPVKATKAKATKAKVTEAVVEAPAPKVRKTRAKVSA
jgi:hypothetical protein